MFATLIVAVMTMVAGSDDSSTTAPTADDFKAYEAAKTKVGRDATSQVRLALWCEKHGLSAEKVKHLALAVLANPADSTARGLLGLVAYQGKWKTPEAIKNSVKNDETLTAALAEYNARRTTLKNNAESHWRMALWCEQKGLKPEAIAHLTTVTRLDPSRAAAWKRLGFKQHGGRWTTDKQLAAERAEHEAQRQAEKRWRPLMLKWRDALAHPRQRANTEQSLALVDDPRAVPVVWSVFAKGTAPQQLRAVQLLGQIDAPGSSRAMAMLAIFSNSPEARLRATETLRRRDPRDYAGLLIGLMRDPIKYEVRSVNGPGSTGVLFVEGKEFNVQRRYTPPPMPRIDMLPGDSMALDNSGFLVLLRPMGSWVTTTTQQELNERFDHQARFGQQLINQASHSSAPAVMRQLGETVTSAVKNERKSYNNLFNQATPGARLEQEINETEVIPVGQMMLAAQRSAALAQQQLANDVQTIETQNKEIHRNNTRVVDVLSPISGQDLGTDRKAWSNWLTDLKGYAFTSIPDSSNPTYVEDIPVASVAPPLPALVMTPGIARLTHSCFGKGTLVRTLTGPQAIETIRVGDRALVQNSTTGALEFEPVVAVYHNPPNRTLKLNLDGEDVIVTGIHRFWKSGVGWVMARDLKTGDLIRTLEGARRVVSVEDDQPQPVFNLEVASAKSFFVGTHGILVHDNSLVEPVLHPFDAPAEPTATPVSKP